MRTHDVSRWMTGSGLEASRLEAAGGTVGADAVEAFGVVANEIRMATLLALWEAYDPSTDDNAITFSDLRTRVGVRDPGQFNYHLGKLVGSFVARTDSGYELQPAGLELVQTVIAGSGTKQASIPMTAVGGACLRCGGETGLCYQDGWLYYVCTDCEGFIRGREGEPVGIIFSQPFPPAGLSNRTIEAVFAVGVSRMLQAFATKLAGNCPQCAGVLESVFEICEAHDVPAGSVCSTCHRQYDVAVRWTCTVCKYRGQAPPSVAAVVHPAAVAFYHEHGIDIGYTIDGFEQTQQVLALMRDHEQALVSTDPTRVLVTIRHDGDELCLTFDEGMAVVDLTP